MFKKTFRWEKIAERNRKREQQKKSANTNHPSIQSLKRRQVQKNTEARLQEELHGANDFARRRKQPPEETRWNPRVEQPGRQPRLLHQHKPKSYERDHQAKRRGDSRQRNWSAEGQRQKDQEQCVRACL